MRIHLRQALFLHVRYTTYAKQEEAHATGKSRLSEWGYPPKLDTLAHLLPACLSLQA
jgi:hypothetical protein